jgi:2-dehydropantoate 2-reductase
MQILVVGAGAIGTWYAAKLARAHHVTLVTRRPAHAETIRAAGGVRVTGLEDVHARVDATAQVKAIEPGALVVLTTKVYDSGDAVRPLASLIPPDAAILCLQNGLGGERLVSDEIAGRCAVLRGITNFGVIFVRPGVVTLKSRGDTVVEDSARSAELAELFSRCDLAGRVSPDMRREVWTKLIVNCVINPLTAMTGMEVGWIADARLDRVKQRIIDECVAVAAHEGITFDQDFVRMLNERYGPSRNLSSMYQDIANGRRTEIDYMNGAVVELGRQYDVPCPVNAGLVAIVKALANVRPGASASSIPPRAAGRL